MSIIFFHDKDQISDVSHTFTFSRFYFSKIKPIISSLKVPSLKEKLELFTKKVFYTIKKTLLRDFGYLRAHGEPGVVLWRVYQVHVLLLGNFVIFLSDQYFFTPDPRKILQNHRFGQNELINMKN